MPSDVRARAGSAGARLMQIANSLEGTVFETPHRCRVLRIRPNSQGAGPFHKSRHPYGHWRDIGRDRAIPTDARPVALRLHWVTYGLAVV